MPPSSLAAFLAGHACGSVPPLVVRDGGPPVVAARGPPLALLPLQAQQVLLLPRGDVPGPDQPVRPLAPLLVLPLPDLGRLYLPDLRAYRLPRQLDLEPRLLQEGRALSHHVRGALPLHRGVGSLSGTV